MKERQLKRRLWIGAAGLFLLVGLFAPDKSEKKDVGSKPEVEQVQPSESVKKTSSKSKKQNSVAPVTEIKEEEVITEVAEPENNEIIEEVIETETPAVLNDSIDTLPE